MGRVTPRSPTVSRLCITFRYIVPSNAGFTVEAIREPGYDDPSECESEHGSFVPELMAKVPSAVVDAVQG